MQTVCGGSSRLISSTAVPWTNVFGPTPKRSRCLPGGPLLGREGGWSPFGGQLWALGASQSWWLPCQLAQGDAWKCPHCKALQQGMVQLSLWTLPDILIIHLKRFCQVGEKRNKLSTLVTFPLSGLNMAPHVAQRSAGPRPGPGPWPSWKQPACVPTSYPLDFLYDLYAVCNHHGSLQGGHYTGEPHLPAQGCQGRFRGCGLGLKMPGKRHSWNATSLGHLAWADPSPQAPARECGARGPSQS